MWAARNKFSELGIQAMQETGVELIIPYHSNISVQGDRKKGGVSTFLFNLVYR